MILKDTIKVRSSDIDHKGVFALKDIKREKPIIRYLGKRMTPAQAQRCGDDTYHFEITKRLTIDGKNMARYINHSCEPNCYTDLIKGAIWIIAERDIKKGEELTYNYGYNLEEALDHKCYCQSSKCVGYIACDTIWKKLKKHLSTN